MNPITYGFYYIAVEIGQDTFYLNHDEQLGLTFKKNQPFIWKYQNFKLFLEPNITHKKFISLIPSSTRINKLSMTTHEKDALDITMYRDGKILLNNNFMNIMFDNGMIVPVSTYESTAFVIMLLKPIIGQLVI